MPEDSLPQPSFPAVSEPPLSPVPPMPPVPPEPPKTGQTLFVGILIGLTLAASLAGAGFFAYQNYFVAKPAPTPQPTLFPTPSSTPDPTANWKTFNRKGFSFKYPLDWSVSSQEYENSTRVLSPTGTIALTISDDQWPFGFGGQPQTESKIIAVKVGDKTYDAPENTVTYPGDPNPEAIYVNFKLDSTPNWYILFGSITSATHSASLLNDYQKAKPDILKTLSTFKFTN